MKVWKVIFAALVIFAAGVVTGGLTVRLTSSAVQPTPAPPTGPGPLRQRGDLLDRLQRQLYLTPEQRDHIEVILRENHDRMKQLWDSIAPQAQEEHRRVNEQIRAELTPEQRTKFDSILKSRGPTRFPDDRRRREERREIKAPRRQVQTNAPPAVDRPKEVLSR